MLYSTNNKTENIKYGLVIYIVVAGVLFIYNIYVIFLCAALTHTHTHTRKLKPTHRYIRRRHNDPTDTLTNSTAYYTIMIVLAFCILETNERTNRNKQEGKKTKQWQRNNNSNNVNYNKTQNVAAHKATAAAVTVLHAFFYSTNHSFNIRGRVRFILGITTLQLEKFS